MKYKFRTNVNTELHEKFKNLSDKSLTSRELEQVSAARPSTINVKSTPLQTSKELAK